MKRVILLILMGFSASASALWHQNEAMFRNNTDLNNQYGGVSVHLTGYIAANKSSTLTACGGYGIGVNGIANNISAGACHVSRSGGYTNIKKIVISSSQIGTCTILYNIPDASPDTVWYTEPMAYILTARDKATGNDQLCVTTDQGVYQAAHAGNKPDSTVCNATNTAPAPGGSTFTYSISCTATTS